MAQSKILANGRLTLTFNSEVRWPALQTDTATEPKSSLRVLEEDQVGFHISELVSAKVLDNGDDDDTGNKIISSISLIDFDPTSLDL